MMRTPTKFWKPVHVGPLIPAPRWTLADMPEKVECICSGVGCVMRTCHRVGDVVWHLNAQGGHFSEGLAHTAKPCEMKVLRVVGAFPENTDATIYTPENTLCLFEIHTSSNRQYVVGSLHPNGNILVKDHSVDTFTLRASGAKLIRILDPIPVPPPTLETIPQYRLFESTGHTGSREVPTPHYWFRGDYINILHRYWIESGKIAWSPEEQPTGIKEVTDFEMQQHGTDS